MDFDIEQDMTTRVQNLLHIAFQRTVQFPRVLRMLQELSLIHGLQERVGLPEVIIHAVPLTRSRFSRRRGYRETEPLWLPRRHGFRDRRLAAARWRRRDDYARSHSKFSNSSRNFSRS